MGRPRGHSRKESGKDWLEKGVHGDAWVKAPIEVRNIAEMSSALRESVETFLDALLPVPSGNDRIKLGVHSSFQTLIRLCAAAVRTGNAAPLRQLADCLEAKHRANNRQFPDMLAMALHIAWGQSSNYQPKPDGIAKLNCTRPNLLRWIRGCFADRGLGRCSEKRLREALKAYGFECRSAPKGGRRMGGGRKPIEASEKRRKRT